MSKTAFVGTNKNPVETAEELKAIIRRCFGDNGWQFLRWPHDVALRSTAEDHPDFSSCREGQVFNQVCELRWQKTKSYELLLLSSEETADGAFTDEIFKREGQSWESVALSAEAYKKTETRLPKSIQVPKSFNLDSLGQRYFINTQTACVQFVSLRVK